MAERLVILAIATEWRSGHGGLSTFNRELCHALAALGHEVYCLVPGASRDEVNDAAAMSVQLLIAPQRPGVSDESKLHLPVPALRKVRVDAVIGHGRFTGPAADTQALLYFPGSRRLHFLHVAPDAIESFKEHPPGEQATAKAEERERLEVTLAASADLVIAVGPQLQRRYAAPLHTCKVNVYEFLPGLPVLLPIEHPAPGNRCLVLGRAEDHKLKGLDIAARAVGLLTENHADLRAQLVVRGAPPGRGDALRSKLVKFSGVPDTDILLREYTTDAGRIDQDIRSASVVLMPSRSEGFGLVALEAIAAGVPVLISDKSGLAEVIERLDRTLAAQHIVRVRGDIRHDAREWYLRIHSVLSDCKAAAARARQLRDAFSRVHTWEKSARGLLGLLGTLGTRISSSPRTDNGASVKLELTLAQRPILHVEQTVLMTQLANVLGAQVAAMHITELSRSSDVDCHEGDGSSSSEPAPDSLPEDDGEEVQGGKESGNGD